VDLLLIVMCGDDTLHSAVTEGCVWGGGGGVVAFG